MTKIKNILIDVFDGVANGSVSTLVDCTFVFFNRTS